MLIAACHTGNPNTPFLYKVLKADFKAHGSVLINKVLLIDSNEPHDSSKCANGRKSTLLKLSLSKIQFVRYYWRAKCNVLYITHGRCFLADAREILKICLIDENNKTHEGIWSSLKLVGALKRCRLLCPREHSITLHIVNRKQFRMNQRIY